MSQLPWTPNKGSLKKPTASPQSTGRANDKSMSSSKSKLASLNEPSPASTYGDTARSSMPATPLETDTRDITANIAQSMRAVQLDPAIKSISGSPMAAQDGKYRSSTAHHAGHVTFSEVYPSPSRAGGAAITKRAPSTNSSPSSGRQQAIRSAPTWRGGHEHSFVQPAHGRSDDPFVSSEDSQDAHPSSPSAPLTYHPNRIGIIPTNNTAQAIFPPQACVFVANLNQSETDDQLEFAVMEAFQRFGNVYVKIRRDSQQMPFAFAQYTNIDDAQQAILHGRGMLIKGRACRTEVARVNRSLYLSKINGGPITEGEAREIMAKYGPIELLWFASQTEREMFSLPEGIFVRYAFFDDCRDAQMGIRDSSMYRLEQVKGIDENRSFGSSRVKHSLTSPFRFESPGRMLTSPSARRITDARSIFIGNVPPHTSEDQLIAMFQMYGRIMHVEVVRKPSSVKVSGLNVFAFLEYDSPQSASLAVQASPKNFQGLRVEHKEPSSSVSRVSHGFSGSPRRNGLAESQEVLMAFQRGLSMGMSQAAQSHMVAPPVHPYYPYYAQYDHSLQQPSVSGPINNESAAATGSQLYGSGYMGPIPGHFPYTPTTAPMTQYPQQHQQFVLPHPVISQYQWPPVHVHDESTLVNTNGQREDL